MFVETVLTIIPTNEPTKIYKSRVSRWGVRVFITSFNSLRESRYIGELESRRISLMRKEIGSKSHFARSLLMLTHCLENIFWTSTIAFCCLLIEVDFKSSIIVYPKSSIRESGLKSWLTFYWRTETAAFYASDSWSFCFNPQTFLAFSINS